MIDLTVKTLDSQNHAFSLEDDQITVRGFKEHIAESVSVPADLQRLIYCGRVLQDDKKLNDYDVNGKVIHLVQRVPPQPGQRRNDNGQGQGQNHGAQTWQNPQRTHYRVTRTQMHGNAMYVGAMSVPAEIVEGHALPVPQLSNRLSNTRLHLATRMLERVNLLMGRLTTLIARDPNSREPTNPPSTSEMNHPPPPQQVQVQQIETDLVNESRTINSTRLTEVTAAVIAAALSAAGANNVTLFQDTQAESGDNNVEAVPVNDTNEENQAQSDTQQSQPSQSEQQGSASSSDSTTIEGQSRRPSRLQTPQSQLMAALLEQLMNAQDCLRPYIERYRTLMLEDRVLPRGGGPGSVEESQTIVNDVSKSLHYLSHACHALSDIVVDMGQEPPRNLRCRPIMIQQSTILQPGVPIQAHFSIHGQNSNNNNTNEESGPNANTTAQSESNETSFESNSQQPEPDASAQQQTEHQEQTQSPFGTVFNLPNDMVVMAVNPEGNVDSGSGNEQTQSGENNNNNNNNNNNGGRISGATGAFSWNSAPTDFIRNIMEAVAGHMVQGGITTTTITTQNHPSGAQQTVSSLDGNTNAGQSTQARSNVGTHPTTATQTRSTSRQQVHPLNVGMSIGQMLEFDPFLPCNSHHVRRTPSTTSNTVTSMSQRPRQSERTSQPTTTENQPQAQTATTSATTTSNTNWTNITSNTSTSAAASSSSSSSSSPTQNPLVNLLQQTLGGTMGSQPQPATLSGNDPDEADQDGVSDLLRHIFYVARCPNSRPVIEGTLNNIRQRQGRRVLGTGTGDLPLYALVFGSRSPRNEGNFLLDLISMVLQNVTLDDFISLCRGTWGPFCLQRARILEFLVYHFPYSSSEEIQELVANELISQIRPHLQSVFAGEETNSINGSRIDIVATIESLLQRHTKHIVQLLFHNDIDNITFGYEIFDILQILKRQVSAVLRYSIRGDQTRFEAIMTRFLSGRLQCSERILAPWCRDLLVLTNAGDTQNQLTEAEIIPLLVYKTPSSQPSTVSSESSHQPSQAQSEVEPMETEVVEERITLETPAPDDNEEIPETFPNHELLPSDWVPIIARDGVRQRRQLQTQTNGGVTTFSDAYLDTLPTKRRKLIEQQKPRLLVSPTPNHSAISASMERLVREGVTRAGVEEVDGAAIGVAVDPGVRRAFGQAIRDCLNPHRYESPDFPDSTRFPNATKYFADQDRPPK